MLIEKNKFTLAVENWNQITICLKNLLLFKEREKKTKNPVTLCVIWVADRFNLIGVFNLRLSVHGIGVFYTELNVDAHDWYRAHTNIYSIYRYILIPFDPFLDLLNARALVNVNYINGASLVFFFIPLRFQLEAAKKYNNKGKSNNFVHKYD